VDEVGTETDYNVFREKLIAAKEKNGKSRPSYAIYDVEFELEGGEGKRSVTPRHPFKGHQTQFQRRTKICFITYINQEDTHVRVSYAVL
jgi:hypothetical protein